MNHQSLHHLISLLDPQNFYLALTSGNRTYFNKVSAYLEKFSSIGHAIVNLEDLGPQLVLMIDDCLRLASECSSNHPTVADLVKAQLQIATNNRQTPKIKIQQSPISGRTIIEFYGKGVSKTEETLGSMLYLSTIDQVLSASALSVCSICDHLLVKNRHQILAISQDPTSEIAQVIAAQSLPWLGVRGKDILDGVLRAYETAEDNIEIKLNLFMAAANIAIENNPSITQVKKLNSAGFELLRYFQELEFQQFINFFLRWFHEALENARELKNYIAQNN